MHCRDVFQILREALDFLMEIDESVLLRVRDITAVSHAAQFGQAVLNVLMGIILVVSQSGSLLMSFLLFFSAAYYLLRCVISLPGADSGAAVRRFISFHLRGRNAFWMTICHVILSGICGAISYVHLTCYPGSNGDYYFVVCGLSTAYPLYLQ
jgi:hypothetical protein